MAFLRTIRQSRWYLALERPTEPLPADPLADLTTSDNALSVWEVAGDYSNLEDVVAAVAATRDYVSKVDMALFEEESVSRLGVAIEATLGDTPMADVRQHHRDLTNLTAKNVVAIGDIIRSTNDIRFFTEAQVRVLLSDAVRAARISPADLKEKAREHLQKRGLL